MLTYLLYEFNLILWEGRDVFTPNKFHELRDNIIHTVTFKGTEEIVGGYNPFYTMDMMYMMLEQKIFSHYMREQMIDVDSRIFVISVLLYIVLIRI